MSQDACQENTRARHGGPYLQFGTHEDDAGELGVEGHQKYKVKKENTLRVCPFPSVSGSGRYCKCIRFLWLQYPR